MRDGELDGMQDFDSVILKMIEKKIISLEDGLSFATNQNNLLLHFNGMGGSEDYASAAPKAPVKTALPVAPPMAKNPNSLLDMIE
jgi:Tfp pilus assembly ATPase PilU